jgi:hypothetical protein
VIKYAQTLVRCELQKRQTRTALLYTFMERLKSCYLCGFSLRVYRVIILFDDYCLSLAVGSVIVLTESTRPAAYTRGGIVAGSHKR